MRFYLSLECLALTIGLPLLLWATADRLIMLTALWGGGALAFVCLWRSKSLHNLWQGQGVDAALKKHMLLRSVVLMVATAALTWFIVPQKFFSFPLQRPQLWLLVMLLYPPLSALPQEIIYRSFFFKRYESLLSPALLRTVSAIAFGLTHLMMNNPVAPILSIFGGLIFADTYARTRSLKWTFIEHAAYGCGIFTIGLGWFFYLGNWR